MLSSEYFYLIIVGVITYFLGNISPSTIIGRLNGIDIKKEGSGNAGTTNALRVLGAKAALITLLIDILKGYIAVRIGLNFGDHGAMVAFMCVVVGHIFPIIYKFKGGKGVATSFGAALSLDWPSAFALLLIALMVTALSKKMSLGSITAAIAYPFLIWYYYPAVLPIAIPLAMLIVIMHHANIRRLIKGEEPSLNILSKIKAKLDQDPTSSQNKTMNETRQSDATKVSDDTSELANVEAEEITSEETVIDEATDISDSDIVDSAAKEKSVDAEKKVDSLEPEISDKSRTDEEPETKSSPKKSKAKKKKSNKKDSFEEKTSDEIQVTDSLTLVPSDDSAETARGSEDESFDEPKDYFADVKVPKMKDSDRKKIAVIDESAVGLALANRFLYQSHNAIFFFEDKETMKDVNENKVSKLLPGVLLNKRLRFTANIKTAVHNRDYILINPENKKTWNACKKALAKEDSTIVIFLSDSKPTISSEIKKHKFVCMKSPEDAIAVAHNESVELHVSATSKEQKVLQNVQETLSGEGLTISTL